MEGMGVNERRGKRRGGGEGLEVVEGGCGEGGRG